MARFAQRHDRGAIGADDQPIAGVQFLLRQVAAPDLARPLEPQQRRRAAEHGERADLSTDIFAVMRHDQFGEIILGIAAILPGDGGRIAGQQEG